MTRTGSTDAPGGFVHRLRVRYAEVDRMGVAYHSRYIEWFEAARTEMLRDIGFPYRDLEEKGVLLPVIEVECRYLSPALYDDPVEIGTRVTALSRIKIDIGYEARHAERRTLLARGRTLHCFTDGRGKPVRADREVMEVLGRCLAASGGSETSPLSRADRAAPPDHS
jgi:acyl-CoA thioester hydrolase